MDKPIPEAVRAQFEAWAQEQGRSTTRWVADGEYSHYDTQRCWQAWQAAFQSIPAAQQQGEAVAWQERYLDIDTGEWSQWRYCAKYIYEAHLNFRVPEIEARALYTAPPSSAPVGVEDAVRAFWQGYNAQTLVGGSQLRGRTAAGVAAVLALAQQPEARGVVDEAMVERAAQAISKAHPSNTGVPFPLEACRRDARIALTAALTGERNG